MLSAIRNSPIAKRLFGEPRPPDTAASTTTEVVSFAAAAAAAEGDVPDPSTPPDPTLTHAHPADAIDVTGDVFRAMQDQQQQLQLQQQLLESMMHQQAATNEILAQLSAAATVSAAAAAEHATQQAENATQQSEHATLSAPAAAAANWNATNANAQGTAVPDDVNSAAMSSAVVNFAAMNLASGLDAQQSDDDCAAEDAARAKEQGTAVADDHLMMIAELYSSTACVQMLLRLKDHDLPLFSDSPKRWTTNGPSLYAYIRQVRPELCHALEEGAKQPGLDDTDGPFRFSA